MRKATPAQSQLPVRNHTTMATMAAGRKRKTIFTTAMSIIAPIIKRISKAKISRSGGKLGSGNGGAIKGTPFQQGCILDNSLHLSFRQVASCISRRLLCRRLLEEERNKEMQEAGLWMKQNLCNRSFLVPMEDTESTK
jgi:hypothetical protein